MVEVFRMRLSEIQPSQLYISIDKLAEVRKTFDAARLETFEPIPVKRLGGDVIFVDGHTRALAAFLGGLREVLVFWEDEEWDWDFYEVCVKWCKDEGIRSIGDLVGRVVSQRDYEVLWYRRCEKLEQELAKQAKK